jgi:hypothetical protein
MTDTARTPNSGENAHPHSFQTAKARSLPNDAKPLLKMVQRW